MLAVVHLDDCPGARIVLLVCGDLPPQASTLVAAVHPVAAPSCFQHGTFVVSQLRTIDLVALHGPCRE